MKQKRIFLVMLLLQLAFFAAAFFINFHYQPRILDSVGNILEYMSRQIPSQGSIFGDDPLLLYRNYRAMLLNANLLALWLFASYALTNGPAWYLAGVLGAGAKKGKSAFFTYMLKFLFAASVFFLLLRGIAHSAFMAAASFSVAEVSFAQFAVALALLYFAYLLFPVLCRAKFLDIFSALFSAGIKKMHVMLAAFLLSFCVVGALSLLAILVAEKSILLLLPSAAAAIVAFAWAKVFLASVAGKLI
jgi:hypothetical protein